MFACDLGLKRKTLSPNFFCCFVFCFREIMQVFLNQPWRQMRASLILLFEKIKAFFGKDAAYVICGKWKRNQQTKIGGYVFLWSGRPHAKIELIWTRKKIRPKKSLTLFMQAPLQLLIILPKKKYVYIKNMNYFILIGTFDIFLHNSFVPCSP